jgi:hypothetical protein
MRKYLMLLMCMVFAGISIADNNDSNTPVNNDGNKPKNIDGNIPKNNEGNIPENNEFSFSSSYYEFGPEIFFHQYQEFMDGENLMKEKGTLYGVAFNVYNHLWAADSKKKSGVPIKWMTGFESEFAYGKVDYDGARWDGTPLNESGLDDFLVNFRFLGGLDFPINDTLLTPYLGLAYRYLFDDSSSEPGGYLRESNYFYLPTGLKVDCYKRDSWSIGGRAEFDLLLYGMQISEILGTDFKNRQDSGYGFLVCIDIIKRCDNLNFKIRPFVRYWNIEESDIDSGVIEPENVTTQYGMQLIFEF